MRHLHFFLLFIGGFSFMHQQSDVCIIGNGAIGKVAALGFAQAGLSVTLLRPASNALVADASPNQDAAWDVRVYALNHVAQALLSSVKVWDALDAARVAPVDSMVVNGDGAQGAGKLAFDAYGARVGALAWIVEDRNLNQALDAALKFASNVRFATGHATRLQTDATSATVTLQNGDTLGASLLVGADGGQSWVRMQCDIDIDYRPYGQRAIVTNFECEKPHHGIAYQWFSAAEGIVALLPLPGQRVSLVWSAPDALAEQLLRESLSQLAERLTALAGQQLGALHPLQPEVVKAFPLALIRPHAITAPRVALVGDAAHVIHPLAGHGMNLGFADVAALLKTVAQRETQRDCGDSRVLARYARSRKEEILLMQLATDGLERLFATDFEPVRVARNIGLNLVNKLPVIKRRLIAHALGKAL
jgi:2-octaprenylphenol hydroxylase